jgi:hypothetical protein
MTCQLPVRPLGMVRSNSAVPVRNLANVGEASTTLAATHAGGLTQPGPGGRAQYYKPFAAQLGKEAVDGRLVAAVAAMRPRIDNSAPPRYAHLEDNRKRRSMAEGAGPRWLYPHLSACLAGCLIPLLNAPLCQPAVQLGARCLCALRLGTCSSRSEAAKPAWKRSR